MLKSRSITAHVVCYTRWAPLASLHSSAHRFGFARGGWRDAWRMPCGRTSNLFRPGSQASEPGMMHTILVSIRSHDIFTHIQFSIIIYGTCNSHLTHKLYLLQRFQLLYTDLKLFKGPFSFLVLA
jgi:hypothetical protein